MLSALADLRQKEVDSIRREARLIKGEFGDPDVDNQINLGDVKVSVELVGSSSE